MGLIPGSGRSAREGNSHPTLVFLPGKFHRGAWGATVHGFRKELDMTQRLSMHVHAVPSWRWGLLQSCSSHQHMCHSFSRVWDPCNWCGVTVSPGGGCDWNKPIRVTLYSSTWFLIWVCEVYANPCMLFPSFRDWFMDDSNRAKFRRNFALL